MQGRMCFFCFFFYDKQHFLNCHLQLILLLISILLLTLYLRKNRQGRVNNFLLFLVFSIDYSPDEIQKCIHTTSKAHLCLFMERFKILTRTRNSLRSHILQMAKLSLIAEKKIDQIEEIRVGFLSISRICVCGVFLSVSLNCTLIVWFNCTLSVCECLV